MSGKWTPGPWAVTMEQKWPFDIAITPNILLMGRIAYSTAQNSLEDVRKAVGFKHDQRDETIRLVAEQEANAHLIAAAPDLYVAAQAVLDGLHERIDLASGSGQPVPVFAGIAALHAALAKARGEA